jgi:hypothetical protein
MSIYVRHLQGLKITGDGKELNLIRVLVLLEADPESRQRCG